MPPLATIIGLVSLAIVLLGLWLSVLRDRRQMAKDRLDFERKVLEVKQERDSKVDLRLERLDTKMETVWAAFTAQLLTVLHHPDPAKIIPDALLKKYEASITNPSAITGPEVIELAGFMIDVAENQVLLADERASSKQLLILIRHHPLWHPTPVLAARLDGLIGPDLHPRPSTDQLPPVETKLK